MTTSKHPRARNRRYKKAEDNTNKVTIISPDGEEIVLENVPVPLPKPVVPEPAPLIDVGGAGQLIRDQVAEDEAYMEENPDYKMSDSPTQVARNVIAGAAKTPTDIAALGAILASPLRAGAKTIAEGVSNLTQEGDAGNFTEIYMHHLADQASNSYEIQASDYVNQAANDVLGIESDPDNQTYREDFHQGVGSALVTGGAAAIAAGRPLVGAGIELGIETLATEAGRALAGKDTVIIAGIAEQFNNTAESADDLIAPEELTAEFQEQRLAAAENGSLPPNETLDGAGEDPEASSLMTGMYTAGLALFAVASPQGRKIIADTAKRLSQEAQEAAAKNDGQVFDAADGGRSLEEQADNVADKPKTRRERFVDGAGNTVNAHAPINNALQRRGVDSKHANALQAAASNTNIRAATSNAYARGELPGGVMTIPVREIEVATAQLDDLSRTQLNNYIYATQRMQDYTIRTESIEKELLDINNKISLYQLDGKQDKAAKLIAQRNELVTQQARLEQDTPGSRSSFEKFSRAEVQQAIDIGNANPAVKKIADMYRKVSHDTLLSMYRTGAISKADAQALNKARPLYVPLREADGASGSLLDRAGTVLKNRFKGYEESNLAINRLDAARNVTGDGAKVNIADDALIALKDGVYNAVLDATRNEARRNIIGEMMRADNGKGELVRKYLFKGKGGTTKDALTPAQYNAYVKEGPDFDPRNYVMVRNKGMIEMYEMREEYARALQFAPTAAVPIMNATRKMFERGTTGILNPAFAPISAGWDTANGIMFKPAGYSFGIVDNLIRTHTGLQNNVIPDPTAIVQVLGAVPAQLVRRTRKEMARQSAAALRKNDVVMAAMAQDPRMAQLQERAIEQSIAAMDRTAHAAYMRSGVAHSSLAGEFDSTPGKMFGGTKFGAAIDRIQKFGERVSAPYTALLESVHGAARYAFFTQNYNRLAKEFGGAENIPKKDIDLLTDATRNLGGDMSRRSGRKNVQRLTSVAAYSNPTIQGARHLFGELIDSRDPNKLARNWSRMSIGLMLPTYMAMNQLSQWREAYDYYMNKVPAYERARSFTMLAPEVAWEFAQTGKLPEKFDPQQHLMSIEIGYELGLVKSGFTALLQGLGMTSNPGVEHDWTDALSESAQGFTELASIPMLDASFAWHNKDLNLANMISGESPVRDMTSVFQSKLPSGDKISLNSEISKQLADTLTNLFGTTVRHAVTGYDVAEQSMRVDGSDMYDAIMKGGTRTANDITKRLAPVNSALFGGTRRATYTPDTKYANEKAYGPIAKISNLLSVDNDKKDKSGMLNRRALQGIQKMNNPVLKHMAQEVHNTFSRKGPYKNTMDALRNKKLQLHALKSQASDINIKAYNTRRDYIAQDIQALEANRSHIIRTTEAQMQKTYGVTFKKMFGADFTFDSLATAMEKVIGQ
jgi:hypothetical protein